MAKNRISHTISQSDVDEFKGCLARMLTIARRITEGTSPDDKTGQPMGDAGGWDFVQRCHSITAEKGTEMFTPLDFNQTEFDRDVALATVLFSFRKDGAQVDELIDLAIQLVGRDLMEHGNKVRSRLEQLSRDHADYKALFEEVNFFYENRGRKAGDDSKGAETPK